MDDGRVIPFHTYRFVTPNTNPGEIESCAAKFIGGRRAARSLAKTGFDQCNPKHIIKMELKIADKQFTQENRHLRRQTRSLRSYEVNQSHISSGTPRREMHKRMMVTILMIAIVAGLGILNNTLAAYLVSSAKLLYYTENPWAAHLFVSMPLTAVFVLKWLPSHFTHRHRR